MKREILTSKILAFLIILFFVSCTNNQVFDQYKTITDGWNKDSIISFNLQPPTKQPLNLFLNFRNNNDYPFSNLFIITKLHYPKGKIVVDTLEYQMANPDGTLMGQGFSDIKESKLWYKEKFVFPETGTYKLTIQQAVRATGTIKGVEKLNGITEIGFRIESLQKKQNDNKHQ